MRLLVIFFAFFCAVACLTAQDGEWVYYRNFSYANCQAIEDSFIWIGTNSDGLVSYNRMTGETAYFNTDISGFPMNSITNISIDSLGRKWMLAGSYLYCFDGTNWTYYTTENSDIPFNYFYDIIIDSQDIIWLSSLEGHALVRFDGIDWQVLYPYAENTEYYLVAKLALGLSGSIWCSVFYDGNPFELACYNGTNWTHLSLTEYVNSISVDSQDHVWIGSTSSLMIYDGTNWTSYNFLNSFFFNHYILSITFDAQGAAWLRSEDAGFAKFYNEQITIYDTSNSLLDTNNLSSFVIDNNGVKWITTTNGNYYYRFDGVNWSVANNGVPSGTILDIKVDSQNNKWFVGYASIVKYSDTNWLTYNKSNSGIPNYGISGIDFDNQDNLWVCSKYYDPSTITTHYNLTSYDGIEWNNYNAGGPYLAIDSNNNKWTASSYSIGHIMKFDGVNTTIYDIGTSGIMDGPVTELNVDELNRVWVGAYDTHYHSGGFAVLTGSNWVEHSASRTRSFAFDNQGTYWVGTDESLYKFVGTQMTPFYDIDHISDIAIGNDGFIWMIDEDNVIRFDGLNCNYFNSTNSPIHEQLTSIAIDANNNKWIGTSQGVYKFTGLGIVNEDETTPLLKDFRLTNYPNPFNPETTISFNLSKSGQTDLSIYNFRGQLVKRLTNELKSSGDHSLKWNGLDANGKEVASGIYFVRISSAGKQETRKVLLVK